MAHSGKTKKAFLKRIKVTSTGKLIKRVPGQNHFNSKDSGNATRRKHHEKTAPFELIDKAKALLPSNY